MARTQVKNVRLAKVIEKNSIHKTHFKKSSHINHLYVLKSIVYIFIFKKEQTLKLEKFEAQALKDTLIRYNKYIIYRIFI